MKEIIKRINESAIDAEFELLQTSDDGAAYIQNGGLKVLFSVAKELDGKNGCMLACPEQTGYLTTAI